jgi:hypothetical protein
LDLLVRKVAALTTPQAGPRHGAGTFNLERSNPSLHEGFISRFRKVSYDFEMIFLCSTLNSPGVSPRAPSVQRPTVSRGFVGPEKYGQSDVINLNAALGGALDGPPNWRRGGGPESFAVDDTKILAPRVGCKRLT